MSEPFAHLQTQGADGAPRLQGAAKEACQADQEASPITNLYYDKGICNTGCGLGKPCPSR